IRDFHVTGVQTCALPIFNDELVEPAADKQSQQPALTKTSFDPEIEAELRPEAADEAEAATETSQQGGEDQENSETESEAQDVTRSEERRVGKEWRSRGRG